MLVTVCMCVKGQCVLLEMICGLGSPQTLPASLFPSFPHISWEQAGPGGDMSHVPCWWAPML